MPAYSKDATEKLRAAALLRQGTPVAIETDTVYGIAIMPGNTRAVQRLCRLKRRPLEKHIAALCADMATASRYVRITPAAIDLWRQYPAGSITVVLPLKRRAYATMFNSVNGTLGIRFPNHEGCKTIIRSCGGIIQASSANISGQAPALSVQDVRRYFPYIYIVGSEKTVSGKASTVIDCTGDAPNIIRA